jgi:hypothetical protein
MIGRSGSPMDSCRLRRCPTESKANSSCAIAYSCPASGASVKTFQNKSAFEAALNQYRNGLAATCLPFNTASLTTFGRSVLGSEALQSLKKQSLKKQNDQIVADPNSLSIHSKLDGFDVREH